jgi:amino acid adenylation domain-containing protein
LPEPDPLPALHEWLHRAADTWPDRPAIVEQDRQMTLAELRAEALAISATLRQNGMAAGDRVALVLDKSRDAIVALYGALLAGAVYIPVPPSWPRARIDAALRASGARIVVVRDGDDGVGKARLLIPATGVVVDWPTADAIRAARNDGPARCDPSSPAFILFTSGSTGTPKGVTISHSAAGAFIDWTAREFRLGPDDRLACPSPLSFDLSTFDVLNIARSGSACVLLPEPTRWVPRLLFQAIAELGVTVWYSVPSALAAVSDTPEVVRDRLSCVRVLLLAGEVFPPRLAVALRAACPRARILNLYGPTETNVVTWYELPADVDPDRSVPIGTACPYALISIGPDVGAAGDRATRGGEATIGELLLAGRSTMLGYWNREADTARAFIETGEGTGRVRYYRSGDRVSRLPGGQLHYIGRTDRQIKRRGIRIEPEEIEHVLGRHAAVAEAAVVATSDNPPVVSAFVRLAPGLPATADDLQLHCATLLPSSMLPDRIVILAVMPRGSRGKVDHGKLLSRQPGDPERG